MSKEVMKRAWEAREKSGCGMLERERKALAELKQAEQEATKAKKNMKTAMKQAEKSDGEVWVFVHGIDAVTIYSAETAKELEEKGWCKCYHAEKKKGVKRLTVGMLDMIVNFAVQAATIFLGSL